MIEVEHVKDFLNELFDQLEPLEEGNKEIREIYLYINNICKTLKEVNKNCSILSEIFDINDKKEAFRYNECFILFHDKDVCDCYDNIKNN